jgi:hypothetical protein
MEKLALLKMPEETGEADRAPMEEMLRELVDEVRTDATEAPALYLAQTVVPRGGE